MQQLGREGIRKTRAPYHLNLVVAAQGYMKPNKAGKLGGIGGLW